MSEDIKDNLSKCSFCGKSESEELILISGMEEDIQICSDCVKLCQKLIDDNQKKDKPKSGLDMTPTEIKEYLDQYVVGQDNAKKILSVAVYNHMKMLEYYDHIKDGDVEISKSNCLIVGSSGVGKTHMIKHLAKLFKVPYTIVDATTLTESGYVGADVETILQRLLNAAGGNKSKAERGIVFIDEIDKKANPENTNAHITRDVSGVGVQQALLKIIEGSIVDVPLNGKRVHPEAPMIPIDTSKILFICGGAFPGIEDVIKRRLKYKKVKSVGFVGEQEESKSSDDVGYNEIIDKVTPDDFRSFGLIPEFLGRLPVICPFHELTEEELCQILTEPKDALVKQYSAMFKYDNAELEIPEETLKAIAKTAINNKTGARGLRSIMEKVLLNSMYEVPNLTKNKNKAAKIVVTKECVEENLLPEIKFGEA